MGAPSGRVEPRTIRVMSRGVAKSRTFSPHCTLVSNRLVNLAEDHMLIGLIPSICPRRLIDNSRTANLTAVDQRLEAAGMRLFRPLCYVSDSEVGSAGFVVLSAAVPALEAGLSS